MKMLIYLTSEPREGQLICVPPLYFRVKSFKETGETSDDGLKQYEVRGKTVRV